MKIFYIHRTDVEGREMHDALTKRQSDLEYNRYGYKRKLCNDPSKVMVLKVIYYC